MKHFEASPFKNHVPTLLTIITYLEMLAGACCLLGAILLPFQILIWLPFAGIVLSAVSLLCLFAGQRVAKDYPGASTLAIYFIVAVLALPITGQFAHLSRVPEEARLWFERLWYW